MHNSKFSSCHIFTQSRQEVNTKSSYIIHNRSSINQDQQTVSALQRTDINKGDGGARLDASRHGL